MDLSYHRDEQKLHVGRVMSGRWVQHSSEDISTFYTTWTGILLPPDDLLENVATRDGIGRTRFFNRVY